ncbi:MAG: toxin-antitoxin system HicB family antitoxin [gamma proteobacterium symbiont of Bathyaustriella thionipta]|nr:toxin-antitoxin system HicB family antitoxin [gamma proteobacterium symbiont of Bathyaustriella thionipta]
MVPESDKYTYRVLWSDEDEEFIGLCAEFPGLSWLASTSEKALKGIRSLVKDCVADMSKNKKEIPAPLIARNYSGKFMVRVPPEVHRHLAIEADESGVSLNRIASAKLAH